MAYHGNGLCVAAQSDKKREARIEDMANRLDAMLREKLPMTLHRLKGEDVRKPYPEPRQLFSDVLRGHQRPAHCIGKLIARMVVDGLNQHDARVFAAQFVNWIDSLYADEQLPSLESAYPQLLKENAEAECAEMKALSTKAPSDFMRALDERTEALALGEIVKRRTLHETTQRRFSVSR